VNFKITLAGDLGSGKSTVSDIIIKRTGAEYHSTGAIARKVAEEHGIDVVQINKYMEKNPELDKEIDDGLVALSDLDKMMVVDSRMAWHFIRKNFSVYLTTDIDVSAARIFYANRAQEKFDSVEETKEKIKERKSSERKRYKEKYGVDCKDLFNYSLVIDTTDATPEEISECILNGADMWCIDNSFSACYICPTRLNYPSDELDMEKISEYSRCIELGKPLPRIKVFEYEDCFYVKENADVAVAYSLCAETFVPCELVKGEPNGKEYVKMSNSL
jgi:predicted cytidylate kinase